MVTSTNRMGVIEPDQFVITGLQHVAAVAVTRVTIATISRW